MIQLDESNFALPLMKLLERNKKKMAFHIKVFAFFKKKLSNSITVY